MPDSGVKGWDMCPRNILQPPSQLLFYRLKDYSVFYIWCLITVLIKTMCAYRVERNDKQFTNFPQTPSTKSFSIFHDFRLIFPFIISHKCGTKHYIVIHDTVTI